MNAYVGLALSALVAYLIGNISPSIMLGNVYGIDIRKNGSCNAGTTNVLRLLGPGPAAITLLGDVLKAIIAVKIGFNLGGDLGKWGGMIAFAFVILGHVFPVIYKFKGGKGVACGIGGAFALDWVSAFATIVIFLLGTGTTKKVSVGSLIAAVAYPFLIWFYEPSYLPVAIPAALFIVYTHIPNIKRLKNHEEPDINLASKLNLKNKLDNIYSAPKSASDDANEAIAELVGETDDKYNCIDYYGNVLVPALEDKERKSIAVIGNGSFGTSIANILVHNGHEVTLYGRNHEAIEAMKKTRVNARYLPDALLSDKIYFTSDLDEAVKDKDILVFAVPAQQFRSVANSAADNIRKDAIVVNLAKGIEQKTLKRMSEVAADELSDMSYVALSGPSHAEELIKNYPASVVVASTDEAAAKVVQTVFSNDKFRIYTDSDIIGVELAGSLKNIYAIATGICDGRHFGANAKAALMTRATHELSKLGEKLGADKATFAGLSGIGDLIVTCDSDLSRNRRFGLMIGDGLSSEEAIEKVGSVVEGYYTATAAKELAKKTGVDVPIIDATAAIIEGKVSPDDALTMLMTRSQKEEKQ